MTRTQIQFPEPLYRRLKEIAKANDWSLADVVRRASELYAKRFPEGSAEDEKWEFPVLDHPGDFLTDPASIRVEADVISDRTR